MTKYKLGYSSKFKKQYKKIIKQGKDLTKLHTIITKLLNCEELETKYCNHVLENSKKFKNCNECHIEPDWLLVYQYLDDKLILLLVETGSHSELF